MGQGTESCTDRPSEVSVIRFVSRNRTIEEIVPKKVFVLHNDCSWLAVVHTSPSFPGIKMFVFSLLHSKRKKYLINDIFIL